MAPIARPESADAGSASASPISPYALTRALNLERVPPRVATPRVNPRCSCLATGAITRGLARRRGDPRVSTVGGCVLQAKMDGDKITLTDETGGVATVTIADVKQSNGVIHVIDKVLLPN